MGREQNLEATRPARTASNLAVPPAVEPGRPVEALIVEVHAYARELRQLLGAAVQGHAVMVGSPMQVLTAESWRPLQTYAAAHVRAGSWLYQHGTELRQDAAATAAMEALMRVLREGHEFQERVQRWAIEPSQGAAAFPDGERPTLGQNRVQQCDGSKEAANAGAVCTSEVAASEQLRYAGQRLDAGVGALLFALHDAKAMAIFRRMAASGGVGLGPGAELVYSVIKELLPKPLQYAADQTKDALLARAHRASAGASAAERFIDGVQEELFTWKLLIDKKLATLDSHELAVVVAKANAMNPAAVNHQIRSMMARFEEEVMGLGMKVEGGAFPRTSDIRVMWVTSPDGRKRLGRFRDPVVTVACSRPSGANVRFVDWVSDDMVDAAVARQSELACSHEVESISAETIDHDRVSTWLTGRQ
jgi:hypothetical protein